MPAAPDRIPIRVVSDVTRAGYNLLNGRGVDRYRADRQQHLRQPPDLPDLAFAARPPPTWATRVLGEHEHAHLR